MSAGRNKDRRRFERYAIEDSVFVTFRPDFEKVGKITDISSDGLAFEYAAYSRHESAEEVVVDIFCHAVGFYVSRIPCKVIYDVKVEGYPSFCGIETRRCALQFGELDEYQIAQLEFFFMGRTLAPASKDGTVPGHIG